MERGAVAGVTSAGPGAEAMKRSRECFHFLESSLQRLTASPASRFGDAQKCTNRREKSTWRDTGKLLCDHGAEGGEELAGEVGDPIRVAESFPAQIVVEHAPVAGAVPVRALQVHPVSLNPR